jgi:hypothetical protein
VGPTSIFQPDTYLGADSLNLGRQPNLRPPKQKDKFQFRRQQRIQRHHRDCVYVGLWCVFNFSEGLDNVWHVIELLICPVHSDGHEQNLVRIQTALAIIRRYTHTLADDNCTSTLWPFAP